MQSSPQEEKGSCEFFFFHELFISRPNAGENLQKASDASITKKVLVCLWKVGDVSVCQSSNLTKLPRLEKTPPPSQAHPERYDVGATAAAIQHSSNSTTVLLGKEGAGRYVYALAPTYLI